MAAFSGCNGGPGVGNNPVTCCGSLDGGGWLDSIHSSNLDVTLWVDVTWVSTDYSDCYFWVGTVRLCS